MEMQPHVREGPRIQMDRALRDVGCPDPDSVTADTDGQVVRETVEGHGAFPSVGMGENRERQYAPQRAEGQEISGADVSERKAAERRRHARLRKRYSVRFGPGDLAHSGYTQDVSESGLYLLANILYPPNTVLTLQVDYPESTLTLRGVVRWSKDLPPAFRRNLRGGMGVEFIAAGAKGTSARTPSAAAPAPGAAPGRGESGPPPEVEEKRLGGGATRRRQVSTAAGNTFEVLQTEYRGAVYIRVYQLPRTDGSAEAVFRQGFWKKEEAEAAVKSFLKDH
jgi:PilZ domain-containing protein